MAGVQRRLSLLEDKAGLSVSDDYGEDKPWPGATPVERAIYQYLPPDGYDSLTQEELEGIDECRKILSRFRNKLVEKYLALSGDEQEGLHKECERYPEDMRTEHFYTLLVISDSELRDIAHEMLLKMDKLRKISSKPRYKILGQGILAKEERTTC